MSTRRANGEGSIRQRSDGTWQINLMDGYKADGKRNIKSFYGRTKRDALAKANTYKQEKNSGIDLDSNYTFEEWADIWFESHKDNITPTTQDHYRYTLRYLKEAFPRTFIRDIRPFDIETLLKRIRREGRSISHLTQCRGMMYQIMHKAEANDLIRKNPVRFAEKMRYREEPKRKEAFTAEEVSILLEKLPQNRIGWSIRLLLGTGMRSQELLALEPRHIEPDGSLIRIEQAINMQKGTAVVGTTKSKDSYRQIPVPENLRYCAICLRDTDRTYIWESRKVNSPCNPSHFRDQFKNALDSIPDVRTLTPHSCRHTYVSQMQALGVDLSTIQSIVGHADTDMTKHYLHVQESIRQDAISKFSAAFGSKNDHPDGPDDRSKKLIPFPNVS